jgi:hypothetical protein
MEGRGPSALLSGDSRLTREVDAGMDRPKAPNAVSDGGRTHPALQQLEAGEHAVLRPGELSHDVVHQFLEA